MITSALNNRYTSSSAAAAAASSSSSSSANINDCFRRRRRRTFNIVTNNSSSSPESAEEKNKKLEQRIFGPTKAEIHSSFVERVQMDPKERLKAYNELHEYSVTYPGAFWAERAQKFAWEDPSYFRFQEHNERENFDYREGDINIEFFKGAKTNLAYNCLDANIEKGLGDVPAILFESDDGGTGCESLTYRELKTKSDLLANHLVYVCNVKPGDVVVCYLPMIAELVIAMMAIARIGAIHNIVFAGYSAEALSKRIIDSNARVLVSAACSFRGGKQIDLFLIVAEAEKLCTLAGHKIEERVCHFNLPGKTSHKHWPEEKKEILEAYEQRHRGIVMSEPWLDKPHGILRPYFGFDLALDEQESRSPPATVWRDAEDPAFILYTSGSTGAPKGILHTIGGYMVHVAETMKVSFDVQPRDVVFCTADIGWITGHSYGVYGPLLNGCTTIIYEGKPDYPTPSRLWQICDKYQAKVLYTAPTVIRSLQKHGDEFVTQTKRESLKVLGSVGEPLGESAWLWYKNVVGKKQLPIVDTWWQTETGGHMIVSLPNVGEQKPGRCGLPFYGCNVAILHPQTGKELDGVCEGLLALKPPALPGMFRDVFGNHERYVKSYFREFDGYYVSGDGAKRDEEGQYYITGRVDDVINCSGHRIGTAEVESALAKSKFVNASAVVGIPSEMKGEELYAFVSLRNPIEVLKQQANFKSTKHTPEDLIKLDLNDMVAKEIGNFAKPGVRNILLLPSGKGIPKTRSGKLVRRVLRKIAKGDLNIENYGDLTAVANPESIVAIIEAKAAEDKLAEKAK